MTTNILATNNIHSRLKYFLRICTDFVQFCPVLRQTGKRVPAFFTFYFLLLNFKPIPLPLRKFSVILFFILINRYAKRW